MNSEDVIRFLHNGPQRGIFHIAGGGATMVSDLLQVPGASGTVIEAAIPYSESSLATLLGSKPDQACSPETARDLAMCAFLRAKEADPGNDRFGFAITASLHTSRQKKGEHRAHFAMQTHTHTYTWSLQLAKELRSRQDEERLLADVALAEFLHCFGLEHPSPKLTDEDTIESDISEGNPDQQELLVGKHQIVGGENSKVIFPGSFNPAHDGHRRMAELAGKHLGASVAYEICIRNVDKPPLNFHDMARRREQFSKNEVWFTNTPTFVEKARAFGAVTFLVGTDTVRRIANQKYYEDGTFEDAIDEISGIGCRFLVFGRKERRQFVNLEDLEVPRNLIAICDSVSESEFRSDLSSILIRKQRLRDTRQS
jgi:nicotinamide mononucleotide (NMN) deamidase PncC